MTVNQRTMVFGVALAIGLLPTMPVLAQALARESIPSADILGSWSGTNATTLHFQAPQRWVLWAKFQNMWRIDFPKGSPCAFLAMGSMSGDLSTASNLLQGDYDLAITTDGPWEIVAFKYTPR